MTFIRWNILIVPPKLLLSECLLLMAITVVIHSVKYGPPDFHLGCPGVDYELYQHEKNIGTSRCYKRMDKTHDKTGYLTQHLDKSHRFAGVQCKNDLPNAIDISPKSAEENEAIQRYMNKYAIRYAWLNAHKDGPTESDWKWTDIDGNVAEIHADHKNWLKAQPLKTAQVQSLGQNITYRYNCLSMVHNAMATKMKTGWAARDCGAMLSYFCVKRPEDTACAEGYRRSNQKCYKIMDTKQNHQEALKACKNDGAMLAEPTDDAAMSEITSFMQKHHVGLDSAWLGATETNGEWKWKNSTKKVQETNEYGLWLSNAAYLDKEDLKLKPKKADQKMAYVCEEQSETTKGPAQECIPGTMVDTTYDELLEAVDKGLSLDRVCNDSKRVDTPSPIAGEDKIYNLTASGCKKKCSENENCTFAIHENDGNNSITCVQFNSPCLNVDLKTCPTCYWSKGVTKSTTSTCVCINEEFTYTKTGCYRVMTENLTHPGAAIACNELASDATSVNLVNLIDDNEAPVKNKSKDIGDVMTTADVTEAWVGAAMNESGEWVWSENDISVDTVDFPIESPTPTESNGKCMKIFKKGTLYYRWARHDCNSSTTKLKPICQKNVTVFCPKGYTQEGEKCYKLFNTNKSHDAAEDDCKMKGFDLANLTTDTEKEQIQKILDDNVHSVWLRSNRTWTRKERDKLRKRYSLWKFMNKTGHVNDVDCTNTNTTKWEVGCNVSRPYICETNKSVSFTHCAENYTMYGERCYRRQHFLQTYDNAFKTCRMKKESAFLPEPHSINQNEEIKMAMGNQVYDTWLGAARDNDTSPWKWNTTGKEADLDHYNNWMKAEPSHNHTCAYMFYSPTYRGWGSTSCYQKMTTICQAKPVWLSGKRPPSASTPRDLLIFAGSCDDKTQETFSCADGKKCIAVALRCDGKTHCQDKSDEADCDGAATLPVPVMLMAGLLLMTSQLM